MLAEMKAKLYTIDTVKETLKETEPLTGVKFPLYGEGAGAKFKIQPGWNGTEPHGDELVKAYVTVNGKEYQLTKNALLQATSHIGLTKGYVQKSPASLVETNMNYWFKNWTDHELKLLTKDDLGLAFTRASNVPFSNLDILEQAMDSIHDKYGDSAEVLADYKFFHNLERTNMRLVIPEFVTDIRSDDPWSLGIAIRNSAIGKAGVGTEIHGYLFRWVCTNGATSTHASSGVWNRRTRGQDQDEVYEWARKSVDDILGHLDHEFDAIQEIADTPLDKDEDGKLNVAQTLEDVFTQFKVPVRERGAVMENMLDDDDPTMYGIMNAITQVANDDSISETVREQLLDTGGDIPRASSNRCKECRRIQPD